MFGRHHSQESKEKIREKNTGRIVSKETKEKMSKSAKARCTEEWCQNISKLHAGTHLSEETKQKISDATAGEKNPMFGVRRFGADNPNYGNHKLAGANHPNAKKVIRLADKVLYEYLNKAAYENGVCPDTMRNYCRKNKDFMYYDEWIKQQNDCEGCGNAVQAI